MNQPVLLCVANSATILTRLKIELKARFGENIAIEIAETGTEALTLLREILEEGREVAVVIADYRMSGMNGDELLTHIHERSPQTMTILLTEPEDLEGVVEGMNSANLYRYLCQPWQTLDLQLTVKEALRRYDQEQDLIRKTAQLDHIKQELNKAMIEQAVLIAQLQEHDYRHQQLLDAVPIGVFVSDSQGKPCYVNQAGTQILGRGLVESVDADQFIEAYQVYQAGTDRLYPTERHPLFQALQGKQGWVEDMEICHGDRRIPVESWGTPIYDRQGHLTHAIAVFLDITERQQAQRILADANQRLEQQVAERTAELCHSQARNQALLAAIPDMILCSQADGTYIDFKPSPTIPTVVSPDAFLGKKPEEVLPPDLGKKIQVAYQESLASGEVQQLDYQLLIDNQLRDYEARIVPSSQQEIIAIVRDISDRKQVEATVELCVRQQAAIAEFGQAALRETDVSRLMDAAVTLLAETLQVDYAKVLQLLPDGKTLLLKAGVGWQSGLVGQATVSAELESQAGYTLHSNEPVIVEDFRSETRFQSPPLLQEHGIISGMSVIIPNRTQPFGILSVHTSTQRQFSQDDVHFLQGIAHSLAAAIERQQANAALRLSEARNQAIIDAIPDLMFRLRTDGIITDYIAPGEILDLISTTCDRVGANIYDCLPLNIAQRHYFYLHQALSRAETQHYEQQYWFNDKLHDEEVRVVGTGEDEALFIIRDISQRKQAEAQIAFQSSLLDQVHNAVIATDLAGTIIYTNQFAHHLYQLNPETIIGQSILNVTVLPNDQALAQNILATVQENGYWEGEFIVQRQDGSTFPIYGTNTLIRDEQGNPIGYVGVSTDISAQKQVEEELRQSKQFIEQIAAASPYCLYIYDLLENRNIYSNQEITTILGYTPEQIQAMGENFITNLLHPDDMPIISAQLQKLAIAADGDILELEYRMQDAQGQWHTLWGRETVFARTPKGKVSQVIGTVIDITERKQAEVALRESQHFVQRIAESSPNLLYIFDLMEQRNVYTNRELATFLGYTIEQIQGMGENLLPTIIHPEDLARLSPYWQQITNAVDGEIFEIEYRVRDAQGKWHTLLARETPFARNADGNVTQLLGTATDISERKQMEAALKDSEQRYELATRAAKVGVWEWNLNTNDCYIDPIIQETLGYEETEFAHNFNQWMALIHPDDQSTFITETQAHLTGETSEYRVEHRMIHKDGSIRWIVVRGQAIHDVQGNSIRMVGTHTDITPRKFAEIALQEAKEAADAANRAKSTFLANMSHELRSPLNAILGFAQLMSDSDRLPPDYQDNLRIIHHSGEHLLTLINQVLDLSKIEAGRITLNPTAFHLNHLLRDVEEMFRLKATEKGITLQFHCRAEVPPSIKTDEIKLRQVLINLISNAVKFTSAGTITVEITRQQITDNNDTALGDVMRYSKKNPPKSPFEDVSHNSENCCITLQFEIKDTGCGITADELGTIFEPFVQSQSGIQSQKGTGLGLAITRKFIQLMGGEITVKSQVRQGTTFTFTIQAQVTNNLSSTNSNRFGRVITISPNQPHYRILIVDDQRENRQLLQQLLIPVGFELKEASNGEEAIECWQNWHPDLILMDLRMPGMDGYAVIQQICQRCRDVACNVSTSPIIIALSASVIEEERLKALEVGCTDFIAKPFHESDLFAAIGQHLGISFIYDEPSEPSIPMETIRLTSDDVAILPTDWLSSFHQATLEGDFEGMLRLIEQIQAQDTTLAQRLSHLAKNFQFEQLLDATEPWGSGDI